MNCRKNFAPMRRFLLSALLIASGVLSIREASAQNAVTISGVILPDLNTAYPAAVSSNTAYFHFTLDFCAISRADHFTRTVTPNANGVFSLSAIPTGKYNVYLKAAEWLRCVRYLDTAAGTTLDFNGVSVPGDGNNDNHCDSSDFGIMTNAFNSDITIPGSGYDPAADFNYDGVVDSADFSDLIGNFNNAGETFATNLTITQKNLRPALTWEAIASAAEAPCSFYIYRTASNSPAPTLLPNSSTALSYTDNDSTLDLTGRITYYYTVRAVSPLDNRESLPSNEFAFKTKSLLRDIPAPGWVSAVPMDSGGGGGAGPSADGSVNLSSGVYENSPGPDIVVRNPNGPDAIYERSYHTGRAAAGYSSPGLPLGWTDNYDVSIVSDATGHLALRYPNGASDALMGSGGNIFAGPQGAPYLVTGTPDQNPMHSGLYTQFTLLYADLSKTVFTPDPNNANNYLLTEMDNLLGQKIVIKRDGTTNRVTEIDDGSMVPIPLLTIMPNAAGYVVQDVPGMRSVQYTLGMDANAPGTMELLNVSRITPVGGLYTPQSIYHYAPSNVGALMSGVTVQNPNGVGAPASSAINYDDGGLVSYLTDANGNTRNFTIGDSSTIVTIPDSDPVNPTPETWTENFNGNLQTGDTDALNHSDTIAYTNSDVPYLPTEFTNKNGQKSTIAYEIHNGAYYGNISKIMTPVTYGAGSGSGILTTTYTYDYTYPAAPMGLLKQIDQTAPDGATRTLAKITYTAKGQIQTIQTPQPSAVGSFVTTTYTYTMPMGNVQTINTPGPNMLGAAGNVTYTFSYTDGGKTEALGEPTSVTDPLGHNTQYHYDSRGNVDMVTEPSINNAPGFQTTYYYNDADQLKQITYPATMQTGTGHAYTFYNYYYAGGGLQSVEIHDETGGVVRTIENTKGNEGEIKQVSNAMPTVNSKYDPQYRLKQLQDGVNLANGLNKATTYHYDTVGNPDKMTYPGGKSLSAIFDADHNVKSATNARNQQAAFILGSGDSSVTGVTYSTGQSNVTYTYDGYGRLASENNGTVSQTYAYDNADNVTLKTVTFDDGTLTDTLRYTYNNDGSVASLYSFYLNNNYLRGFYYYSYDNAGNLMEVDYPWRDVNGVTQKVKYAYDEDDRLTKQTTNALVTTYTYNARSQRISLDNEAVNPIAGAVYPNSGQKVGAGKLIAKYDVMQYDGAGNLTGYNATYQPWYVLPHTDAAGGYGPNSVSKFNGTYSYAYDGKDRLASETVFRPAIAADPHSSYKPTNYAFAHTADAADNLMVLRGQAVNGGYNADNQFIATAGSYDADGNYQDPAPSSNSTTNGQYDAENRLLGLSGLPAGQNFPVGYHAGGLRAQWGNRHDTDFEGVASDSDIYQVYSGGHLLYEMHQSRTYFYEASIHTFGWGAAGINQQLIYSFEGNGLLSYAVTHYAFDPQGSPVNTYNALPTGSQNAGGDWNEIRFYDAYGQARASAALSSTDPFIVFLPDMQVDYDAVGFGGQWGYYTNYPSLCATYDGGAYGYSATATPGLLLLGYRYYEPQNGRFTSRDPIGYEGGVNLYAYCGNNPIMNFDPSGTDWLDNTSNFFAGWGDTLSFGATGGIRQLIGVDGVVDRSSGAYIGGEVVGTVQSFVEAAPGVIGAVRAIRTARSIRTVILTGEGVIKTTGFTLRKEGGYFLKTAVNAYGRQALQAQVEALKSLGKLAPEWSFENGVLRVKDVGKFTGKAVDFLKVYFKGASKIGLANDIRPRNIGANKLIFDPALHPVHKIVYHAIYVGARPLRNAYSRAVR